MAYTVNCPSCGKKRNVSIGTSVTCDGCRTRFSVDSNGTVVSVHKPKR